MAPNRADLRVMVDANILIAGSLWPRWPYEVLQHALAGDFQLVLSPYVIAQARRFLEKDFPEQAGQLDDLLEAAQCEMAPDPTREQVAARANLVRDASDVPVALAAIQSKVDFLVSTQTITTSIIRFQPKEWGCVSRSDPCTHRKSDSRIHRDKRCFALPATIITPPVTVLGQVYVVVALIGSTVINDAPRIIPTLPTGRATV